MLKTGFNNQKYLKKQTAAILERIKKFDNKLYLEFGGKLCFDYHASRVLPGYDPQNKIKLLQLLKDKADILICVFAEDIEKGRIYGDFNITYDIATLKLIDDLKKQELETLAVVITRFNNQPSAIVFKNKLERRGIKVYVHYQLAEYPTNVDQIVSEEGFGKNEFIPTKNPIVIVTGPGPNSGKLATCLSQLYWEHKQGINAGYAKFETFPVWNLPLKHPVNIAYEAATADIQDFNLVDPFYLNTHNKIAINYNRDVESFPILKSILNKIFAGNINYFNYNSPTEMGLNCIADGITNDKVIQKAAKQELIRRYFRYRREHLLGTEKKETVEKVVLLMKELNVKLTDRPVVEPARKKAQETKEKDNNEVVCGAAIQLANGTIVTGKNSKLMSATSSAILNAIKILANLPEEMHLISPRIINQASKLKKEILKAESESLTLGEILIALAISAATNPIAELAMKNLSKLKNCEMHLTHIPHPGDEIELRKLNINLTTDDQFLSSNLVMI